MTITPFNESELAAWRNNLPAKTCAAAVICVNNNREMLAVKASYKDRWSLPGGSVDRDEPPRTAALRELMEETQITLQPDDLQFAGVVHLAPNSGMRDSLYFLFIARGVSDQPQPDGHEILEAKWMNPEEFKEVAGGRPHALLAADIVSETATVGTYLEATL